MRKAKIVSEDYKGIFQDDIVYPDMEVGLFGVFNCLNLITNKTELAYRISDVSEAEKSELIKRLVNSYSINKNKIERVFNEKGIVIPSKYVEIDRGEKSSKIWFSKKEGWGYAK